MKVNKWTVGLVAVGAVSLASVAQADEKASVLTSVASTTLSGYVDTSMQWNMGTGDTHAPAYKYGGAAKADGFNLDAINLTLEKPLDEAEWAAGYKVDLLMGPDADVLATQSTGIKGDFAIKQAYVALRAPIGNGLDFKVGVFDSVVGYESTAAINNPNFSRSWGHTFEPSQHTGVLSTYRVNNNVAFSAGIANTLSPAINGRSLSGPRVGGVSTPNESYKTYMTSVALTAPDDWGFIAGSSLYAGLVDGFNAGTQTGINAQNQQNYYTGVTMNTPVTGLRVGTSFDYVTTEQKTVAAGTPGPSFSGRFWALYASYQATEKLSLHNRLEFADISGSAASLAQTAGGVATLGGGLAPTTLSATSTLQYDLWKNVLSRLEIRWDHDLDGLHSFGGTQLGRLEGGHATSGTAQNSFILAANIIYKF